MRCKAAGWSWDLVGIGESEASRSWTDSLLQGCVTMVSPETSLIYLQLSEENAKGVTWKYEEFVES